MPPAVPSATLNPKVPQGYVPQLDALRFFAALTVALVHGEQEKQYYKYPILDGFALFEQGGGKAVTFFFSLSGFLITWLLLRERERTGTVDLRAFYTRRILRIWPLYYLIVVSGLFVIHRIPHLFMPEWAYYVYDQVTWLDVALYMSFFSNVMHLAGMHFLFMIGCVWSIGLEEQFYIFWPVLVGYVRRWLWGCVGIIAVFGLARLYYTFVDASQGLEAALIYFRIDNMAIGAVAGYAFWRFGQKDVATPSWLRSRALLWAMGALVAALTWMGTWVASVWFTPILAGLDALLILMVAVQPDAWPALKAPWLRRLGQASYGVYMYNVLALVVALTLMTRLRTRLPYEANPLLWNAIYYTVYVGVNLGLALLSYKYFELPFLQLKKRFERAVNSE